jgi:hypothetical protein
MAVEFFQEDTFIRLCIRYRLLINMNATIVLIFREEYCVCPCIMI